MSFFAVETFNPCQVKSLFGRPLYDEAIDTLARTRPKIPRAKIDCVHG